MIVFSIVVCVCLLFSSSFGSSNIGEKDLSLHSYTPDGKVEQLAFASRAIDKGPPRISFRDRDTGLITSFAMSDLLYTSIRKYQWHTQRRGMDRMCPTY